MRPSDAGAVVALNAAVVEWTSPMDLARFDALAEVASYFRVAEVDGVVAGFMIGMFETSDYDNDNFAWFKARYDRFFYIDRVVVGSAYLRRGVGGALYANAFDEARIHGVRHAVGEYTWSPRNEESEQFHQRMGFHEVGQRTLADGEKVVSMQCLSLRA